MKSKNLAVVLAVGLTILACAAPKSSTGVRHEASDSVAAVHGSANRVADEHVDCRHAPCGLDDG